MHGLVRLVGPTTVDTTLSVTHLSSASGELNFNKIFLMIMMMIIIIITVVIGCVSTICSSFENQLIFRYLDQLAMSAKYDTKTYCRQSLVGGNYGLLNKTTFAPNPDYYR